MIPSPTRTAERSPSPRRLEPAVLTPIHQRTSRRIRGEPPEFGCLSDSPRPAVNVSSDATGMATQAAATPSHIVLDSPRTPEPFHGDTFEDAEDWLDGFERVAGLNGWDESRKLRYVYFALRDSARTWFENHEASLLTWGDFRRELLATYPSTDRKEKAEAALQVRNQRNNESVAMYIEDMCRLFRRADPNMAEEKKLRHLMRGVKEELFAGLVRNQPRTVSEFRSEATVMEKALQQRARLYNRDVGVTSVDVTSAALTSNMDILREVVRAVVREELQKIQLAQGPPAMSSLADVVRQEVRQAIQEPQPVYIPEPQSALPCVQPQQHQPQLSYVQALRQNIGRRNIVQTAPTSQSFSHSTPPPMPEPRPRKCDVWRTADRRPLCYHCGEAGHLYRECQYRRVGLRGFPVNAPCPRNGERPYEIEEFLSTRRTFQTPQQRESRASAPMRYRSPSPRPSSASPRRRSPSPRREN